MMLNFCLCVQCVVDRLVPSALPDIRPWMQNDADLHWKVVDRNEVYGFEVCTSSKTDACCFPHLRGGNLHCAVWFYSLLPTYSCTRYSRLIKTCSVHRPSTPRRRRSGMRSNASGLCRASGHCSAKTVGMCVLSAVCVCVLVCMFKLISMCTIAARVPPAQIRRR